MESSTKQVSALRPDSIGVNLVACAVACNVVVERLRPDGSTVSVAEIVVADETGCVVFLAKGDQIALMNIGQTYVFTNARVQLYRRLMRLEVDKWGSIAPSETPLAGPLNEANNVSETEHVSLVAESL
eukprot:Amastigsp_a678497_6.p2 type:complete len:128 gc:universal Amastigsp_a678497_6:418-35(-)